MFGIKIPVPTRQYAVRRYEFDAWMISRAHVPVKTHCVKNIIRKNGFYIIDDQYRCRYLIGAGGTHCPVYRSYPEKSIPDRSWLLKSIPRRSSFNGRPVLPMGQASLSCRIIRVGSGL
ncbi:hypothetical protein [uncultured Desulfobacter sp.]|uniref:NAD(P)/FAD-dependent oxidoreductase n=1 Tax=uncultured Desulfobacter sp. TaxID=240139 RepID=UPI0029F50D68|nr:hypothetical protein [uncultured Desulfobacter sp.]